MTSLGSQKFGTSLYHEGPVHDDPVEGGEHVLVLLHVEIFQLHHPGPATLPRAFHHLRLKKNNLKIQYQLINYVVSRKKNYLTLS